MNQASIGTPEAESRPRRHTAQSTVRRDFVAIVAAWTLFILGLIAWGTWQTNQRTTHILLSQARPFFKQIVTTRLWNARHGGVYVPITHEDLPNPYLDVPDRDVETRDGLKLTLINPAYMTRQIAELAWEEDNVRFHLTSNRPIRPANAPEPWEGVALAHFKSQDDEYYERYRDDHGQPFFRYMAPLWVEESCLRCHTQHGYTAGDLRGGLSVTFSAQEVVSHERESLVFEGGAFVVIWALGLLGLILAARQIRHLAQRQETLIHRLENTLHGLVPICASCKSIRNDDGRWERMEHYISKRSQAKFSHGICPDCAEVLYSDYLDRAGPEG